MNEHWHDIQPFKKTMDEFMRIYTEFYNVLHLVPCRISQETFTPQEFESISSRIDELRTKIVASSRKLISDENDSGSIANVITIIDRQELGTNDPSNLKDKFVTEIESLQEILNKFTNEYDELNEDDDDKLAALDYIRTMFIPIMQATVAYSNYISLLLEIHEREMGLRDGDDTDVDGGDESDGDLDGGGGKKRRRRLNRTKKSRKSKKSRRTKKSRKSKKSRRTKKSKKK